MWRKGPGAWEDRGQRPEDGGGKQWEDWGRRDCPEDKPDTSEQEEEAGRAIAQDQAWR